MAEVVERSVLLLALILTLFVYFTTLAQGQDVQAESQESKDLEGRVRMLQEEVEILKQKIKELEAGGGTEVPHETTEITVEQEAAVRKLVDDFLAAHKDEVAKKKSNVLAPMIRGLKLTGQVRAQFEDQLDFDLDSNRSDDNDFVRLRTRLGFDADISDHLRAFVQLQDSRFFGEEHSVLGNIRGVDLKEGYIDFRNLGDKPLILRIGRQELKYGDQRLISPLDWHHITRSWDGVRLMYDAKSLSSHLWATKIDERFLTKGQNNDEDFYGFYNTLRIIPNHEFDGYFLIRRNQDKDDIVDELGRRGTENLYTIGTRGKGKTGDVDYVAEAAWQVGDHAKGDIHAFMVEGQSGYTFSSVLWSPRIGGTYIFASGDDNPFDGDQETFNQLYTFGHFYLGYTDLVGRRNINNAQVNLDLTPLKNLNISMDYHWYWLDTSKDALYNAAGRVIRPGDPTGHADEFVGHEIDLHFKYRVTKNLTLWAGWSHFFAEDFLEDTGSSDDADFLFLQITLNF